MYNNQQTALLHTTCKPKYMDEEDGDCQDGVQKRAWLFLGVRSREALGSMMEGSLWRRRRGDAEREGRKAREGKRMEKMEMHLAPGTVKTRGGGGAEWQVYLYLSSWFRGRQFASGM